MSRTFLVISHYAFYDLDYNFIEVNNNEDVDLTITKKMKQLVKDLSNTDDYEVYVDLVFEVPNRVPYYDGKYDTYYEGEEGCTL